jgi:hypothetical protein
MWGLLAQLGLGALGEAAASADKATQQRILERMLAEFDGIKLPDVKTIVAEELGPQAMEGVFADDELKGLERESLGEMMKLGRSGGLTLEDRANLNTIRGQTDRSVNAANERIREQMAARGQSGGGAELAMRLSANQGAAQRLGDEGLQLAGMAQRRARDAMLEGGRMASQMGQRDFSEKSRRAEAADKRMAYNTAARERANLFNAEAPQQRFQNEMARTAAKSGQLGQQANFYGNQADSTRQLYAGMGKAAYSAFNPTAAGAKKDEDED